MGRIGSAVAKLHILACFRTVKENLNNSVNGVHFKKCEQYKIKKKSMTNLTLLSGFSNPSRTCL